MKLITNYCAFLGYFQLEVLRSPVRGEVEDDEILEHGARQILSPSGRERYPVVAAGLSHVPDDGVGDAGVSHRELAGLVKKIGATLAKQQFQMVPSVGKHVDGKTINLADYRGKTVVLEWLNFECPFVRHHYEKASTMIDLAKKYKSEGVVWLAINSTNHTTPAANKAFTAKHNLPFPILDDRPGKVGRAYDAKTTPHMFIIGPRGQIVYEGAIDNSPLGKTPTGKEYVNYVDNVLAALVANKDIPVRETKPYGCSVKYAK